MKKIILVSFVLGLILTLISWISVKGVPCGEFCWGGTYYHGFPLKYYQYSQGDVIRGNEWLLYGEIIWNGLIIDVLFWSVVGFISLFILSELKKF